MIAAHSRKITALYTFLKLELINGWRTAHVVEKIIIINKRSARLRRISNTMESNIFFGGDGGNRTHVQTKQS